jgi:hypothetical protein
MLDTEAKQIVDQLVARTGGNAGWSLYDQQQFVTEISAWGDVAAAQRAATKLGTSWMNDYPPPFAMLEEAYLGQNERTARNRTKAGCGGAGWLDAIEKRVVGEVKVEREVQRPCPTCNPILAAVFRDENQRTRYLAGVPLSVISEEVLVLQGQMHAEYGMPQPCQSYVDSTHPEAGADRLVDKRPHTSELF